MSELNDPLFEELVPEPKHHPNSPTPRKGFRLLLPFTPSDIVWRGDAGYYRHGFKHELRDWLLEQVGQTGNYVEWEAEKEGVRWLYTGSNQLKFDIQQSIGFKEMAVFRFVDKRDAMLTKLTWWGRM